MAANCSPRAQDLSSVVHRSWQVISPPSTSTTAHMLTAKQPPVTTSSHTSRYVRGVISCVQSRSQLYVVLLYSSCLK